MKKLAGAEGASEIKGDFLSENGEPSPGVAPEPIWNTVSIFIACFVTPTPDMFLGEKMSIRKCPPK